MDGSVVDLVEAAGILYREVHLRPAWSRYPNCLQDNGHALALFLEHYGYEHQGRNPSYAHAASEAVMRCGHRPTSAAVWRQFASLLPGQKLNERHNPLFHEEGGSCQCVACVIGGANLVRSVRDAIAADGIGVMSRELMRIRGIGPKIAALFLRDTCVHFELMPLCERHLLQPVDIWVRRGVSLLRSEDGLGDEEIAAWIATTFSQPEMANQGLWYLGANVAQSWFRFERALHDAAYGRELLSAHVGRFRSAVAVWRQRASLDATTQPP
ncbi:hypothetical protein FJZ36_14730 [Candidatus Poribacteria bacterium]|nr:hypothetical protein [Candidatus Poribacteria bacterium]